MAKGTQELQTSYDQNWRIFAQGDDALNQWGEKLSQSISMQVNDLEMILRPALDMVTKRPALSSRVEHCGRRSWPWEAVRPLCNVSGCGRNLFCKPKRCYNALTCSAHSMWLSKGDWVVAAKWQSLGWRRSSFTGSLFSYICGVPAPHFRGFFTPHKCAIVTIVWTRSSLLSCLQSRGTIKITTPIRQAFMKISPTSEH